jgi:hypothetical protein
MGKWLCHYLLCLCVVPDWLTSLDVDNEMEHSNPSEEIHCAIPSIRIYRAMGEQISVVYVPQSLSFIMCVLIATHPTLPIISRLLMFTEMSRALLDDWQLVIGGP